MKFRVRWFKDSQRALTTYWIDADSTGRAAITAAAAQIDQLLRVSPASRGESRESGVRILFAMPLGVDFRIEPDGKTVSVLRVWLLRKRPK